MKILLVNPESPTTFWSFRHALKFISRKAVATPLGLLTVAAMLPSAWQKKLVDMDVSPLGDPDIEWADYVFLSGMGIQMTSFKEVVKRCNALGVKVVAGGPLATMAYKEFDGIDHFVLDEAEATLGPFIRDLAAGTPKPLYRADRFPDISKTPIPMWSLLEQNKYNNMCLQYSRGCPFDCEFCNITVLNGRKPRVKSKTQFIAELESLYQTGWRGDVFIVDDNLIGNRAKLKNELLPAMIKWSKKRSFPFRFFTEVSIDLADDDVLIELMVKAGFKQVFIGIETTNQASLVECGKKQNLKRDLIAAVKKLQRQGLIVHGGFIVGFDHDPPSIFEQQIDFIQKSGMAIAMVGLLNVPPGTRLFKRLEAENRLLDYSSGDNMDGTLCFIPKMDADQLKTGYQKILRTIFAQDAYYKRIKNFLKSYRVPSRHVMCFQPIEMIAFFRSLWIMGVLEKGRKYYWKLLFLSLFCYPQKFPIALEMGIWGYHFRRIVAAIAGPASKADGLPSR